MDTLDYGLSSPQLALMGDGNVFVAGQVQAPMNPPTQAQQAQSAAKMSRPMAADAPPSQILQINSCLDGIISTGGWDAVGYPENAALKYDSTSGNLIAETMALAPSGVRSGIAPPIRPTKARISIPLPGNADGSTNPATPITFGTNILSRNYLIKIKKPNFNYVITGIKVWVQAGASTANGQYVLGSSTSFQPTQAGLFWKISTQSDISIPSGSDDESVREATSLAWTQQWLPSTAPAFSLEEFYRVLMTFSVDNPSGIQYGSIGGQLISAPSDTLSYTFQIQYKDYNGKTGTWLIPSSDIQVSNLNIMAHWNAAQMLTNQWYPHWMENTTGVNDDTKWCSLPLFTWLQNTSNRQVIGPVNDITLEHGRNSDGHHAEHLRGNAVDVFHPGYGSLIGSLQANGSPTTTGQAFIAQVCSLMSTADPTNVNDPTRQQLVNYIIQARLGLQGILAQISPPPTGSGLYLMSVGSGTNSQYVDVRNLIWNGKTSIQTPALNLIQDPVNGGPGVLGAWNWGTPDQRNAIGPDNTGTVHTTHIHLRPLGSLSE